MRTIDVTGSYRDNYNKDSHNSGCGQCNVCGCGYMIRYLPVESPAALVRTLPLCTELLPWIG